MHRQIDERGYGAQAFAILSKIREWDICLEAHPDFALRVYEVHPEVCFAALDGGKGLQEGKKTPEGAARRLALLQREFGEASVLDLSERVPRRLAAPDDVLDALVALWSAERIANGRHGSLPTPGSWIPPGVAWRFTTDIGGRGLRPHSARRSDQRDAPLSSSWAVADDERRFLAGPHL